MSRQEAKRFMDDAMQNPLLPEGTDGCKEGDSAGECYARIAREIGCDFTAAELEVEYAAQQELSEKKIGLVDASDEELSAVVGGKGVKKTYCHDTHVTGEWCWFTDSCSWAIMSYKINDRCKHIYNGTQRCDADDLCLSDQITY